MMCKTKHEMAERCIQKHKEQLFKAWRNTNDRKKQESWNIEAIWNELHGMQIVQMRQKGISQNPHLEKNNN